MRALVVLPIFIFSAFLASACRDGPRDKTLEGDHRSGRREASPSSDVLRLAVTTSTRDSGLLERIVPVFERRHSVRVDVIAVGTGKALQLGKNGDVDVVLVHARQAEEEFMKAGYGIRREAIMQNTFELLGPPSDPADIRGMQAVPALQTIASRRKRFVSRGDESGTHKRELKLWRGEPPEWEGYIESGQGMGATLIMADQMQAYVLSDRGTYVRFREKIKLLPLAKESDELLNPYSAIVVNPQIHPLVAAEFGGRFVDFLISRETQRLIGEFRVDGEPLFQPLRLPADH